MTEAILSRPTKSADRAEQTISDTDDRQGDDDIPTLTSVVARERETSPGQPSAAEQAIDPAALAELEVRLASASLDLTDRLLHSAFQEMEAAMFEQVSNRLRAELPELVARIIREHFGETS